MKTIQDTRGYLLVPENQQEVGILNKIISDHVPAAWPPANPPADGWPQGIAKPEGDEWKEG